ncbi:S-adenosylmethionine decarboxylase [Metschnikowia bicuspidata var. bicuspidata NRRL YB-4993]|uniref:S-adenosylmethionine decarboxylase n=1 Tax=Metschnikowia bicuspidata var. bicuspidata NRRL YB-4993 TaxID=869754 RepID=A0A1A0HJB4_9ASCO|nr:S-adenosylmethionine decarboxylase [Metschnikowia bicuspidata var. bicuspidata NRRL YB-4993]OBA23977.1 S-adenosylmethionine decarboxylase [Metschnikowia bicuspidata var. bicuspidata NRRL YB-4993]
MVAPAYSQDTYVDHDLSTNLDSTFAFEGPEKLLEVWFWPSPDQIPDTVSKEGLRAIPLEKWKAILDLVNCKVLSMKSSAALDAYLLLESSLFVFPHKMILKTCGTTTTLACIDEIFHTARSHIAVDNSSLEHLTSQSAFKVFYSRRSFMFPDRQIHVHTDWKNEVQLLNRHFKCGKLYVVGDFTSDDHWYLYMGGCGNTRQTRGHGHDQTFEILMTRLDPAKTKQFVTERKPGDTPATEDDDLDLGHDLGLATMASSTLDAIFRPDSALANLPIDTDSYAIPSPQLSDSMEMSDDEVFPQPSGIKFIHDAFSFTPCGFSSNSVSQGPEGFYYTLHITPEAGWSYASFETNYPFSLCKRVDIVNVLKKALAVFQPGKFSMTLFSDQLCKCNGKPNNPFAKLAACDTELSKLGYNKQEKAVYDLKGEYDLLYLNFEKQS